MIQRMQRIAIEAGLGKPAIAIVVDADVVPGPNGPEPKSFVVWTEGPIGQQGPAHHRHDLFSANFRAAELIMKLRAERGLS